MKVFLIGFMGCGKSYLGRALGTKLSLPFFDLDEKIEEREGQSISSIFQTRGEEYFRVLEKETLHIITESHESMVMATGGGTPCYFNNIDYLKKHGIVVWLNCSIDCLHRRLLKEREKRPLVSELNEEQLKTYIIKKFSNRKIFYQQAQIILNEEEVNIDHLVNKIFHQ